MAERLIKAEARYEEHKREFHRKCAREYTGKQISTIEELREWLLKKTKQMIRTEIRDYVDLLQGHDIRAFKAYLFGSFVRGGPDRWSDVDLAVVTDRFIGDSIDFTFLLSRLARRIDPDIEPRPYLLSEFNKNHPSAHEIILHGEQLI